jgi:SNF2 family DNA or RNA helicase
MSDCILLKMKWGRVIFDEAHHLRNHKTKRFAVANKLISGIKWFVTGTPVQNARKDLYNLLCLIGLDSKFYKDENNWPFINKHYILRRTKAQVGIEIPCICKEDISVQWKDHREQRLSEEIHSLLSLSGVSENRGKSFSKVIGDKGKLSALLRARQSCVLPSLMSKSMNTYIEKGLLIDSEYSSVLKCSSKIDAVTNLILERKDNGKGKIIFCHFTNEIDMIACRLKNEGINHIVRHDGRSNKNINIADKADVLIMQIQTGCEGLNLQEHFSEVYFVSPHWNPCVEDQAIARCHRIGQKETVNVFKFEMVGFLKNNVQDIVEPISMEKYVNKVQNNKREISKEILEE